ncbi:MAG: three-Cys-motif partner protein TcmP [Candidatus Nezhaarchaeales archaeon]
MPRAYEYIYRSDNAWPGIKLSILAYYLDIYTLVAKKYFEEICYVDTFAGSGIIEIRSGNEGVLLYGSPILSILVPRSKKKFNKYFFVDLDQKKTSVLEKTVEVLHQRGIVNKDDVKVITADMNKVPYRDLLKDCVHALVFVDPEGTEPEWSTVNRILNLRTDLLFNFMTAGIRRSWGRAKSGGMRCKALDSFYGDNVWMKAKDDGDLVKLYADKLNALGRKVIPIKVTGTEIFYYHILIAVKPTRGGNPWLEPVLKLRQKVEKTDSKTFARLLDVFRGKMKPLTRIAQNACKET